MNHPFVHVIDDKETCEFLHYIIGSLGLTVKCYATLNEFIETYDQKKPACLLLNIKTKAEGMKAKEELDQKKFLSPIIFTSWENDLVLAVSMMKLGAADFLLKPFNEELLIEGINKALRLCKKNQERIEEIEYGKTRFLNLSPREKQILEKIVEGKSNRAIGLDMNISIKTVAAHRFSMMKKMKVKSISKLVKIFYEIKNHISLE